jgi:hypothetical protein
LFFLLTNTGAVVIHIKEYETRNARKIVLIKPKWKKPLERPSHGCDSNVKTDLREMEGTYVWTAFVWLSHIKGGG